VKRALQARPDLAGVVARSRVEEPVVLQKPTNAILLNNRIAQSLDCSNGSARRRRLA